MGIVSNLTSNMISSVGNIIDDVVTTDEERETLQLRLEEILQRPELKELDERIAQAQHPSLFVAGGRPFVIWAAGLGIAYNVICVSFLSWLGVVFGGPDFPQITPLDWDQLLALAGLAGGTSFVRHLDKVKGVSRSNLRSIQEGGLY